MKPQVTLRAALNDPNLLDMAAPSWIAWRSLLLAAMGEPLLPEELEYFRKLTGRAEPPGKRVDEFWCVIGRRGGKSKAVAALCVYIAGLCEHRHLLSAGERGVVMTMAADRRQAGVILAYVVGLLERSPILKQLIVRKTSEEVELSTGITIEVRTASFRSLRGFTSIAVVADEIAIWYSDESANPDTEILAAVRPTLATTGGPLIAISSPYARKGAMWETYSKHFGPGGDPAILVAQGETLALNLERDEAGRPKLQSVVDRAFERDPADASAEYGAQFRSDLEAFVSREVLADCTDDVAERPYEAANAYVAFTDPSGGSADAFTLAIAHVEDNIVVLDLVREVSPPFMPSEVVEQFADIVKAYKVRTVQGDRYAGEWPPEQFARCGVQYETCELSKSEIYQELLPLLNSRTVALLENDRLQRQLLSLERRTSRAGRDAIDHPRGGRDDLANAVAGALVLAQKAPSVTVMKRGPIQYPPSWGQVA